MSENPQEKQKPKGAHIKYLRLKRLKKWPGNPKSHDVDTLDASIKRFGFVQPLLKDERSGRLIAGHGRLETLERMQQDGEKAPVGVRVSKKDGAWLVPVVHGLEFENEEEAEAYLLTDNRLVELGGWRDEDLAPVLERLSQNAGGLDGVGFGQNDLQDVLKRLNPPDPTAPDEFPEHDEDIQTEHRCPKCGFEY
jgi:hypothetical protein